LRQKHKLPARGARRQMRERPLPLVRRQRVLGERRQLIGVRVLRGLEEFVHVAC
jgi:hypothetical protein